MNRHAVAVGLCTCLVATAARAAEVTAYPPGEAERQYAALKHDLARRDAFAAKASQVLRPEALILASDRDPLDVVLRRTGALASHLQQLSETTELAGLKPELSALVAEAANTPVDNVKARRALFDRTLALRRRISFANPLLDFDRILFIKRHRSVYGHMCDQYYAVTAVPGGGLYVLADAFGEPQVRDVLADAVVTAGRLKGERLGGAPTDSPRPRYDGQGHCQAADSPGGAFLSPDLSFDASAVLFAYTECRGDANHVFHTDASRGHWHRGRCYHIFRVNLDGTGLVQLTDGTWNEFDPCFLPGRRIAFISERRGGYLRCGRVCPTYTLHDMAADGSDIRCLSYHETNEWQPSVTHDGRIAWTRWDYIDRSAMATHNPWITTPDGRNPRALHANYTLRSLRPDMELDIRAIPGSHRFVATGAPHHGQGFGSLVVFDPRVPEPPNEPALWRVTPDVDFPETQRGTETYGQPWPLSEDFYLAAYDPAMQVPGLDGRGHYGLYLVDSFGNKELIYRDATIGCHSPIPVRPRPVPPTLPDKSDRVADDQPAEATVTVANVYHSSRPWPPGTKIKALRIYQVLPMSVSSGVPPHDIGWRVVNDSVNIARSILGTVPVEPDGSAHFVVPARRELYFQALDEEGLAVTSMRSGVHFQPGEQASCQGCHEPRQGVPPLPSGPSLTATRREPSRPEPDVDGTSPFSYPRLVQPVLDRHCVSCHGPGGDPPRLDREIAHWRSSNWIKSVTPYYTSYLSLAPKYTFSNYPGSPMETLPGQFGARASGLYKLLVEGHYDVKLTRDEMHRITVWLDSASPFYGVYEAEGGAAQRAGQVPQPTLE